MEKKTVLACIECGSRNYTTKSNHKSERLELRKFCKVCGTHTIHRQTK